VQLKPALVVLAAVVSSALLVALGLRGPRVLPAEEQVEDQVIVDLYVYNAEADIALHGHVACSPDAVLPVRRQLPATATLIRDTLELLFRGELTQAEQDEGFSTEFPLPGVRLMEARLSAGTLELDISDPEHRTTGGACRTTIMWAQIEQTALQFSEVEHVRTSGELFQP